MRTVTAPTAQLLAWIAERSPGYTETLEVWRTSCPRLAVWEDALADGLVRVDQRLRPADGGRQRRARVRVARQAWIRYAQPRVSSGNGDAPRRETL